MLIASDLKVKTLQAILSKILILRSWRTVVVSVLLVAMLSSCAVKFVYNRLDWLIPWYLSDYLSLDANQERLFENNLQVYLSWHRKTQLPLYSEFLNQVADKFQQGMKPADIAFIQTRTEALSHQLVVRLLPDMLVLFKQINDAQLEQLFAKFKADNQDYWNRQQAMTEQQQRAKRAQDIQDYVERWTGSLSRQQIKLIEVGTKSYQLMSRELLLARMAWQQQFRQVLSVRTEPEKFKVALTNLLMAKQVGQSERFKQQYAHNEELLKRIYLQLDQSLSKRQRQHAVKKLHSYAADFAELAGSE